MNTAGHIAVAAILHPAATSTDTFGRTSVLLGSALPDICNIAQVKLRNRPEPTSLAKGVDLHHRTDSLFHAHTWFRDLMSDAMQSLLDKGVNRGAARACSHVGPELLLDGALLEQAWVKEASQNAFEHIEFVLDELAPMVDESDREQWVNTLQRLAKRSAPIDHSDPGQVAIRLERILRSRPRLALAPQSVPVVVDVLTEIQPSIQRDAQWLAADLAKQLN